MDEILREEPQESTSKNGLERPEKTPGIVNDEKKTKSTILLHSRHSESPNKENRGESRNTGSTRCICNVFNELVSHNTTGLS